MADEFTAEGTLANVLSGVQNRSRLTPPDRKAYDPSTAEISILNQLSGPGASQLVGFLGGARADRQAASDQYDTSLAAVNNRAAVLAQQDDATKRRGQNVNLTVAGTQNPDSAAAFTLMREQISPNARGLMDQMAITRGQYRQAQVEETRAQAAERLANAADGGNGSSRRDPTLVTNGQILQMDRAASAAANAAYNRIVNAGRTGNSMTLVNGLSVPLGGTAPISPEVIARAEAARVATLESERARQRGLLNRSTPQSTPQPAQQGATPAAPAVVAPTAPVAQPAAPAAAAPTVVTPEARTRAQAQATAAGGTLQVNPTSGAMRIKLPNGTFQPVGQ
jgi:hypothetical protein